MKFEQVCLGRDTREDQMRVYRECQAEGIEAVAQEWDLPLETTTLADYIKLLRK